MHCLIGFDQDARALQGLGPLPRQVTRDYFGFRCDSDLAQFTAVRAGVGIGGCQHIIARDFRELVPLLAKAIRFELEVWIATHEDMKFTARARMLFDHLAAGLWPLSTASTPIETRPQKRKGPKPLSSRYHRCP
jgi:DNA-binding transcriptional LysR family regulator